MGFLHGARIVLRRGKDLLWLRPEGGLGVVIHQRRTLKATLALTASIATKQLARVPPVRVTLCRYCFIASKPGDATMQRLLVLAVTAALANCATPSSTAPSQGADNSLARIGKSQPAPFTRRTDYVSPDSRERLCSDTQLANRDNSYGMLTKATTSYYCY